MTDGDTSSDPKSNVTDGLNGDKAESQPPPAANPWATRPNGGLLAWTQVLGSFFLAFNTWYDGL